MRDRPVSHFCTLIALSLQLLPTEKAPSEHVKQPLPSTLAYSHECLFARDSSRFKEASARAEFMTKTRNCMFSGSPDIPQGLLAKDEEVIAGAYPQVRTFYPTHSEEDWARISILAWAKYRSQNASGLMTKAAFVQVSKSFGQLIVKSDPPGAAIKVDSILWEGPTNTTDWTEAGNHSVTLSKKACNDEQDKIQVPAGGSVTFEKKLTCK
jgi:hypothetical protein